MLHRISIADRLLMPADAHRIIERSTSNWCYDRSDALPQAPHDGERLELRSVREWEDGNTDMSVAPKAELLGLFVAGAATLLESVRDPSACEIIR